MKNSSSLNQGRFLPSLILAALSVAPAAVQAQTQDYWQGGSADYNVATNWSLTKVPASGYAANNDSGSANICYINAGDPNWTLNGFRDGVSASGAFVQNGATITLAATQNGWLRMGLNSGSIGYYTINSNAILNTSFGITVGETGSGVLNIYGGTVNIGTEFIVNDNGAGGSSGTVNQTNGTVNCNTQTWIGQGAGGQNGVFNLSGGFFGCTNWFVLGRSGGSGTLNMTGGVLNAGGSGGYFDVGTGYQGSGVGIINQSAGTINIVGNGQFVCPETSGGAGTYNLSGTGALYCNNWLAIGRGGVGTLNMSGGMIVKTDTGGDHIDIGAGGSTSGSGTGTVNQTGGIVTNTTTDIYLGEVANGAWNFSGGTNYFRNLIICEGAGINSTMNADGGFLAVNSIYSAQPVSSYSTLELNGSTVQALASTPTFIYNLTVATIQPGGVIFDSQTNTITIPQALGDGGGGSLIKIGSGQLTLSGANSYAGNTIVSNGVLSTTTASTGGGNYTAVDGTTLDVSVASANTSLPAANMTLGSSSGATLQIDLGSYGNPSVAPIAVTGALTANGTVTINVTDGLPAVGQFKLISYGSLGGAGTFNLGSVSPGIVATLSNDTTSNSVDLVVTSAGAPYWNGTVAGGVWDVGITTNWLDLATGNPETFRNGEPVLFNDNATGTTTVSLSATVQPGAVTVDNNLLPYTLTGSGSIAGATGLLKEGSNIFTVATSGNTFTGPTTIAGGVLSVANLANGGSASALGASSASPTNLILDGGTLSYTGAAAAINRGYTDNDTNGIVDIDAEANLSLGGSVAAGLGSGFTKAGPAQLAYTGSGTNILSDSLGYTIAQGTVVLTNSGSGQIDDVVGSLFVGSAGSTNAVLSVNSNATLNLTTGGDLYVGDGGATNSAGIMNQQGGAVNLVGGYQVWVGQGSNGVGTLNLSGGAFNVDNWLAIGRANGAGTLNLSSNATLNINGGGAFDIGTSAGIGGDTGTGTFNQTGGFLSNNCPTWLGEGASGEPAQGTWNMSGGTALLIGATGQNAPASLMIGQSGIATNTLNLSGTAAITCANYVSVGHLAGVTGVLNVGSATQPGGSLTMSGGSDFNVGDSGAGVLNMVAGGGGQVTIPGTLYLTRGSSAAGAVNLNGGILLAGHVNNGYGFGQGNGYNSNPQSLNFNGGTLKALGSANPFIQPYVYSVVQAGGAVIDDGGYAISINAALTTDGNGGGLTKLGTGTLALNAANTYTGTTLVSAGALGIGPAGSIAGPVVVASGAALDGDTGTIGTAYINNTLTLDAGSTTSMKLTPSSNDQIAGLTGVTYGGALVVTNTSGLTLTVGEVYKLFNCAVTGTGNFSSVTILPSGAGTFNPSLGTLTIISSTPATLNPPAYLNGNVILTGSGGTAGGAYELLSSTNITTPLAQWITNTSGVFSGSGTFSNIIPITNVSALFFDLKTP